MIYSGKIQGLGDGIMEPHWGLYREKVPGSG
jgi:hypothetical protein